MRCLFRLLHLLKFYESVRMGFNKSSTKTCETHRHLPYSVFSYFLKGKQRSASSGIQEVILLLSGKEAHKRI